MNQLEKVKALDAYEGKGGKLERNPVRRNCAAS